MLLHAVAPLGCFSDPAQVDPIGDTEADDGTEDDADDVDDVDETGEGVPTVTLSGTVTTAQLSNAVPLAGVKVSVVGDDDRSAVTDATGAFELEVLADRPTYLAASPSTQYFGTISGVDVRFADIEDIVLFQLSQMQIDQQVAQLQIMEPDLTLDDSLGSIGAVSTLNSLGAALHLSPPTTGVRSYSLDAMGNALLDGDRFAFGLFPMVVYFNVPEEDADVWTLTATVPMKSCTADFPSPPTLAGHLTLVGVGCS